jgi:hypothetical protein
VRFGAQLVEKATPRRVHKGLSQTVVFVQVVDTQIFYRYQAVAIYNLTAFLMGEVLAFELGTLMGVRHHLTGAYTLWASLFAFSWLSRLRQFALGFSQCFFTLAKETGVFNGVTVRQGGKGCKSGIKPHLIKIRRQKVRVTLHREASVPFIRTAPHDGQGIDSAFEGAVQLYVNFSKLGEVQPFSFGINGKATLSVGEAIVATITLEAGIAWFLTALDPAKKALKAKSIRLVTSCKT